MTANMATAGARDVISVSHPNSEIQLISGQSIGTFYTHYHYTAAAIFSIALASAGTISGDNIVSGGFTQNISIITWSGGVQLLRRQPGSRERRNLPPDLLRVAPIVAGRRWSARRSVAAPSRLDECVRLVSEGE